MSSDRQTEIMEQEQETITGGVTNINSDHSAIHMGFGAIVSDIQTLTNGAEKEYCITTPVELYPHFKNIVIKSLGGSIKLEIIKGATVTVNTGDALIVSNPNDNSSYVPEMTIKEDPTYTGGDVWDAIYALSDSTNQTTGNAETASNDNQELVMKNGNEQYIIKITNLTTDTIIVAFQAFWYEEPQGVS